MSVAPGPPTPPVPPAAPVRLWDTLLVVVVPITGVVIAIATIIISYQISRISDLADGIKNVNNRVDQIYPLIAQSTSDLGYIKGSLEATTMKISGAAEKSDQLTKRIELVVGGQEAQSKNIQDMGGSLSNLSTMIISQQHQIEGLNSKISSLLPLYHKNSFDPSLDLYYPLFADGTVFGAKDLTGKFGQNASIAKFVAIDWEDKKAVASFLKSLEDSNLDFGKLVITTKDSDTAKEFKSILMKSGLSSDK